MQFFTKLHLSKVCKVHVVSKILHNSGCKVCTSFDQQEIVFANSHKGHHEVQNVQFVAKN